MTVKQIALHAGTLVPERFGQFDSAFPPKMSRGLAVVSPGYFKQKVQATHSRVFLNG